ncbi:hypothetical protein GCM10009304_11120 [Pseudomonas matsuisoli]|uniref:Uncharacterized protein n=1 Tax=Pseudomonas matsuisoli TaxID=1515666 RepID=A0A917UUG7_9PSED|nr:hypothetical protein GCM10009304_11120 [Pseudomonas matsuisoli]
MQMDNLLRPGSLVQIINVLGHDGYVKTHLTETIDSQMPAARLSEPPLLSAPKVPAPY